MNEIKPTKGRQNNWFLATYVISNRREYEDI